MTRSHVGCLRDSQPWRQPAQDAARQAQRQAFAGVAMLQPPDFRLPPRVPECLHGFPVHKQIVDGFDQQYVLLGNARAQSGQIQHRPIQRLTTRLLLKQLFSQAGPDNPSCR